MKDINELKRLLKSVESLMDAAGTLRRNCWEFSYKGSHFAEYDLRQMHPKICYDGWTICWYEVDDKFYLVEPDRIIEVVPTSFIKYRHDFVAVDDDGNVINEDDLATFYPSDYCGETDDMQGYAYFNIAK